MAHLINIDEFRALSRPMSSHIDSERMLVCIDEAERLDIIPNIGDTLFLNIMDNLTSDEYKLLLEGGVYSDACGRQHILKGLKSAVAYYAYARLIRIADNELTRYGFVAKSDEYSERRDEKAKVAAYTDAKIVADGYLREVTTYLGQSDCACGRQYRQRLFKYGRTRFNVIGE